MSLNSAHEGYNYQDLITSYFILKELLEGNWDSIFTIDKKNTSYGVPDRFDDLVITNGTKIQRKQIKYSNDSTSKTLEKDDLANDSGYGLAIYKLYETWCDLRTIQTEFRLCLAWNEPVDDNICRVLYPKNVSTSFDDHATKVFQINLDNLWEINPENFNRWNNLKKYVKESTVDRNLFNEFCNDLIIEVNFPKASLEFDNPNDLEIILIRQAEKLGIGQYPNDDVYIPDFLVRLAELAGKCRSASKEIAVKEILNVLRIKTNFGEIEQKFQIDPNKNVVSDSVNQKFLTQIIQNKKNLLIGEPGAGKSWFLTNFIEYLESKNIAVIRHYCFTSIEDDLSEQRVLSDVFFGNLIASITKKNPNIKNVKENLLASNLKELNILLSQVKNSLVIVIDGLDHIERTLRASSSLSQVKTRIINYISQIQINPNITIVLGSQLVTETQDLIDKNGFIKIDLPSWEIEDIKKLMVKFNVNDIQLDHELLSTLLSCKSQGNPLYLTYILKTIGSISHVSKEIIDNLPPYDFNLHSYYEHLSSQLESNTTSEILACLDFNVTRAELKEIIPIKHHFNKEINILSPVISENSSRGGIRLYHDSFRRFNIEKLKNIADLNDIYELIISWLLKQGFFTNAKSYRNLLSYLFKVKKYKEIVEYADKNFLNNSLFHGQSESAIKNNIEKFVSTAGILQDWSLFIYINELNRTISSTNSEDNHSQFIENFDLYFEAVCLIHGAEQANSLLFFNGEKNFNIKTTAKAFKILQKHGYSPRWKEIDSLFNEDINLEDIQYYVYSCADDDELKPLFLHLVKENNKEFIEQVILALIEIQKIDSIFTLYNNIDSDENDEVAEIINRLLKSKGIKERIEIATYQAKKSAKLKPLSIDFNTSYIESSKLNEFYSNISLYAQRDISILIDFEKTIPSINFFYNWIKFFIRFFIIEATVLDENKEQEMISNFHFLSSDIDPYKGSPRVVDFTYGNNSLINHTIEICLKYINSQESWDSVIKDLKSIPYPTLPIIESNFINHKNINFIIDAYNEFHKSENSDYSEYANYCFKKAIYHAKSNNLDDAVKELKQAIRYITSYSFRKDTTLSELIVPLCAINKFDTSIAKKYAKKLKYLSDAVMRHTEDGKGIRWLAIDWFKELLNIDNKLATMYLIHEFIKDPYFWKLDYMFVELLNNTRDINPIILNFLYKLSPTNNRDEFLNGFLDLISELELVDKNLARLSLINLCNKSWNDSYNSLNSETLCKFKKLLDKFSLLDTFNLKNSNNNDKNMNLSKYNLSEELSKQICKVDSIMDKSEIDIISYYTQVENLSIVDLNNIYFYLKQSNNKKTIINFLNPIIRKRFHWGGKKYFDNLFLLVNSLNLEKELAVYLFINIFIYSQDGNFNRFVYKESLKEAVKIDESLALKELSKCLTGIYPNSDYMPLSTANLIIGFEYAGVDKNMILDMYDQAFSFIENRLPSSNQFDWNEVENVVLSSMNNNELGVSLILSKTKHYDAETQREILVAISYLMTYDQTILIKPLKWLFNNFEKFNHLPIAGLLEILLIEKKNCIELLNEIKGELIQFLNCENLYIRNICSDLTKDI